MLGRIATRAARATPGRAGMATVAVGMSGGVDSSVAAMLLRDEGHDVVGVHMQNWDAFEESDGTQAECAERDTNDARRVCERLGIGFHEVSFVREYWQDVFEVMLQGYHEGGTPNPDVMCNRHIKFDRFVSHALGLGADLTATGHYAQLDRAADGSVRLLTAADETKDQSYFLSQVRQGALRSALFPLGGLRKTVVRARAAAAELHTAAKRDSAGICFIGRRNFGSFLQGYLPQAKGEFVCVTTGASVGTHRGYAVYTPGQRARISGQSTRWYVVGKDAAANVVHVCEVTGPSTAP